jgi:hypothetical protein
MCICDTPVMQNFMSYSCLEEFCFKEQQTLNEEFHAVSVRQCEHIPLIGCKMKITGTLSLLSKDSFEVVICNSRHKIKLCTNLEVEAPPPSFFFLSVL